MNKKEYSEKVKKDNRKSHFSRNVSWVIKIVLASFFLSLILSFMTDSIIPNVPIVLSVIVLFTFILIGIIFDMIGVSVTVADAEVFHSMASKKVKSAKTALSLIKINSKVSSFCNDVIGDVCGIISGSAGVTIAMTISKMFNLSFVVTSLIVTSIIASITIGGKALGKSYAINKSNSILYNFARFIDLVTLKK